MEKERNIIIKPIIRGNEIVAVEINQIELPLISNAKVSDLQELVNAIETFCKYFDLEELAGKRLAGKGRILKEFEPEELVNFLNTLSPDQILVIKVLAEVGRNGLSRGDLVQKMKELLGETDFKGWDLGGKLAGISVRAHKTWGKESIFERCHIRKGSRIVSGWRLKEKYLPIIRKWLQERGESL